MQNKHARENYTTEKFGGKRELNKINKPEKILTIMKITHKSNI